MVYCDRPAEFYRRLETLGITRREVLNHGSTRRTQRSWLELVSILAGDPLTQLAFSVHESKGVFAVLLGSGLSRAAEIPTGWEITLDLIRRVGLAQGVEDQPNWAAWYRQETGLEPDYSALLEELVL